MNDTRQTITPLYDAVLREAACQAYRLHIPAHRQGQNEEDARVKEIFRLDLTELPGLDDLHCPQEAIAQAQSLAAQAYGADSTFFLVNGTTVGLHALMLAFSSPGKKLILPRNVHGCAIGALILSGADPVFVDPLPVGEFNLAGAADPVSMAKAIGNVGAGAVLALHPTYLGITGDLSGLAEDAHRFGMPLLVDEAHGAHLRFHPGLPADALSCGADACVQSTHKLGGALTQSSLLHLKGRLIDGGSVQRALSILETSSPSYILMAFLDRARSVLAHSGHDMLDRAINLAAGLRKRLAGSCPGLTLLGPENVEQKMDPLKIVIMVQKTGLTGYEVASLLHRRYRVRVEMAAPDLVLAVVGIGTTQEDTLALALALEDICRREGKKSTAIAPEWPPRVPARMRPRSAWFSPHRMVPLKEARGQTAGELITIHPPGMAVICPGEEFTPEVVDYLCYARDNKLSVHGAANKDLEFVSIVDQKVCK